MPDATEGASILLVEDDAELRSAVASFLRGTGHHVDEAADAATALARWEAGRPDVVLLDLGLPDLDGVSVIRRIRRDATTPILVLSARDREEDKIEALENGADDYVTKPFGVGELRARIHALLRRAGGPTAAADGSLRIGGLHMDVASHRVTFDGQDLHLRPREYQVLKVLMSHPGRLVTHGRLLRAVWGAAYDDDSHYLHVYVSQIRRRIATVDRAGTLRQLITAEPGVGYRVLSDRDVGPAGT